RSEPPRGLSVFGGTIVKFEKTGTPQPSGLRPNRQRCKALMASFNLFLICCTSPISGGSLIARPNKTPSKPLKFFASKVEHFSGPSGGNDEKQTL
ncbi:MAG: hypothetical protein ABIR24_01830, partial [Verrucomicrobiota bacterium]